MRVAIWSITVRSAARSSSASSYIAANTGSSTSGARRVRTSASSAMTIRCLARSWACSSRCMTYRTATALSTAHSSRTSRGTTSSAPYRVSGPGP